jgi:hypothetical protein
MNKANLMIDLIWQVYSVILYLTQKYISLKIKLLIALFFTISVSTVFCQEIKFADLASAQRGEFTSYLGSDGAVYKIGDRVKIGVPSSNKTFAFITECDGFIMPITNLNASSRGTETEIKKIFVVGNKRVGYSVSFRTKGLTGLSNYTIQFENALSTGEVKGFGFSSDDALAQLKKGKDKLDLGLITQEEYDKLKSELIKYSK